MSRSQDDWIERLALDAGSVAVRPPYSDGSVEVTIRSGETWLLSLAGTPTPRPYHHSIDWSAAE